MILSRESRIIWKRRIKSFWLDFSHNRIGLIGLALLILYILMAATTTLVSPFTEAQMLSSNPARQADTYAMPEWFAMINPPMQDWPREHNFPLNWSLEQPQLPASITTVQTGNGYKIYFDPNKTKSSDTVSIVFTSQLDYQYTPSVLRQFNMDFNWEAKPSNITRSIIVWIPPLPPIYGEETGSMEYILQIEMTTPNNTKYPLWDQNWFQKMDIDPYAKPKFWGTNATNVATSLTPLSAFAMRLGYQSYETSQMVRDLFSAKGVYTFTFNVTLRPGEKYPLDQATGTVELSNAVFTTWGRVYGLLGTDGYRHDVFSQLILGSRISIIIGISAALISVTFGLLVGITAGYLGGLVDEALMRLVDILICLPVLPILLVLIAMFGYNVYFVVLVIAIFGWQGLSRVIRSQVLSLREMPFVDSAIASGGSKAYIMVRHIIPNVLPIALTSLVLAVPGAIILEAALSFLGFGDPFAPTWGKMLQNAYNTSAFSPTILAWWSVLPPGLAITFLCLAFVFIGHAIDEIVNPRLRRRR